MLRIRLARAGAKKRPFYHIVVADVRAPRDGRYRERLGFYNPVAQEGEIIRLEKDRISYWLSQGAQVSDRVHRLLAKEGLMPERIIPDQTKKNKPHAKALELKKAREEKLKAKAEAEAEEAAATESQEETAESVEETSVAS